MNQTFKLRVEKINIEKKNKWLLAHKKYGEIALGYKQI